MDRIFFIYLVIVVTGAFLLVDFIKDVNDDDVSMMTKEEKISKRDALYYKEDVIGDTILIIPKTMKYSKKKQILKRSPIFKEIIDSFPMFSEMEALTNEKILDEQLKKELLNIINDIQDKYLSGEIDSAKAKERLYTY